MRAINGLVALLAVGLLALPPRAEGREKPARFVRALQGRKMPDMAVLYLEGLRSRPGLDAATEATIDLEIGECWLEVAQATLELAPRLTRLASAEASLSGFLARHPGHPRGFEGRAHLARVRMEQACATLEAAGRPSRRPEKEMLLAEARAQFDRAEQELEQVRMALAGRIGSLTQVIKAARKAADEEDTAAEEGFEREELRDLAEHCRLFQADLAWEDSRAYDAGTRERTLRVERAIERYRAVHGAPMGISRREAMVRAAECLIELGRRQEALALCEEFAQAGVTLAHGRALVVALKCWRHPADGRWEQGAEVARKWLEVTHGLWQGNPVYLAVRWELAQTLEVGASSVTDLTERAGLLSEARDSALVVARSQVSEHAPAAQAFLRRTAEPVQPER